MFLAQILTKLELFQVGLKGVKGKVGLPNNYNKTRKTL